MNGEGICTPTCDEVPSDPDGDGPLTEADDRLIPCRIDERCDQRPDDVDDPDRTGRCRVPCTTDATCPGIASGERCELEPDAPFGFCEYDGQRCTSGDEDCHFGQRCDLLGVAGPEGRCVDGCTSDAACDAGEVCVIDRGVCRRACDAGCGEGERCVLGLCEQA